MLGVLISFLVGVYMIINVGLKWITLVNVPWLSWLQGSFKKDVHLNHRGYFRAEKGEWIHPIEMGSRGHDSNGMGRQIPRSRTYQRRWQSFGSLNPAHLYVPSWHTFQTISWNETQSLTHIFPPEMWIHQSCHLRHVCSVGGVAPAPRADTGLRDMGTSSMDQIGQI